MRSQLGSVVASALVLVPLTSPCYSADYPYNGFYSGSWQQLDFEVAQAKCALSFTMQDKDGSSSSYYLDTEEFLNNKVISYIKALDTICKFDASKKMESCEQRLYDQSGERKYNFDDYLEEISSTKIISVYRPSSIRYYLYRCLDFSNDTMLKFLSDKTSTIRPDKFQAATNPDMSPQSGNRDIGIRVLQQMRSGQ